MQGRSRILVIDDDPMFRSLVVSLLRKDHLVSVAADGESGFAKAREHRPDLVIIDHQMPGWTGVRTLQTFRMDRSLAGVKVMMLTSDASKETVMSAIQAGTDEYIIKTSFHKAEFLNKIQKLLGTVPAPAELKPNSAELQPDLAEPSPPSPATPQKPPAPAIQLDLEPSSSGTSTALEQEDERIEQIMDEWE